MIEFKYSFINDRENQLEFLKYNKTRKDFKIIDVGASMNAWDAEFLDATLDLNVGDGGPGKHFIGNINEDDGWAEVLDYVALNGKFDYSVCTHTLEDIAYPKVAMEMLPEISKAGFIAIPSHYQDLIRIEGPWPGYQHHRWMFVPRDGKVVLVPKIPFVGFIEGIPAPRQDQTELQIFWSGELPFEILNGDYLGPNVEYVKKMYLDILGGHLR